MKLNCSSWASLAGAAALLVCAAAAGGQGPATEPRAEAAAAVTAGAGAVTQGINALACDLYEILKTKDAKNLAFSPFSIEAAMAMAYAGAQGNTAAEMEKALHLTQGQKVHAALGALLKATGGGQLKGGNELDIANAQWIATQMKLLEPFSRIMAVDYGSGSHAVRAFTEPVRVEINAWVAKQTKDKITDLIPKGVMDPIFTRFVLINAIYFKGAWLAPFKENETQPMTFTREDGKTVTAPGMHHDGKYLEGLNSTRQRIRRVFIYAEDTESGVKILEMPYAGEELSMVVVLPDAVDGLVKLKLTAQALERWVSLIGANRGYYIPNLKVTLPKFKLKSKYELIESFKALGIKDAFDVNKADFWGMTPPNPEGLYIQHIFHQAWVEVDEKGTEAAAATAVIGAAGGAPPRITVFNADHPFLFLIRDRRSGAILFLGRVTDPTEGSN